ncbi:hypothetical protein [Siminovitchia fortis]|uniref:hypothetical protein n=1 Tax=Siminovitchia fortis TaxID=254758 RepID=UPI0011A4FD7D|nr:hypothetical protein [Siminovitchia fortis]
MKKMLQTGLLLSLILLAGACSNNATTPGKKPAADQNQTEKAGEGEAKEATDEVDNSNHSMTQAEVIEAVKDQFHTNLTIKLPNELPLNNGKHLTATTKSDENRYSVVFFQSDEPIPINNEELVNDSGAADRIARIDVKKYESQEAADEEIAFENFSEIGGQPTDLGHHITGYQDAGAGSVWTSWNEGRWALSSHAFTNNGEEGTALARDAVQFLEDHTLPVPKPHGHAFLDAEGKNTRILWQDGQVVYAIDQVSNPMDALKIATAFEK